MYAKSSADRVSGGVFLIGLAVLFTPLGGVVGGFWPGILFVLGATAIAHGLAEGVPWYSVSGGLWLIGLGVVFLLGFSLPLLLIIAGLAVWFGHSFKPNKFGHYHRFQNGSMTDEKLKHEDFV